jgi:hypothetical protein
MCISNCDFIMVIVMNVWYVDYRLSSAPDPISCAKSCALKDGAEERR